MTKETQPGQQQLQILDFNLSLPENFNTFQMEDHFSLIYLKNKPL